MTEDEAREKWCPMVRYPLWPDECSGGNEGAKCIASGCMMWEPYDYWVNEKDQAFAEDADHEKRRNIVGGDCGLKRQPAE